MYTIQSEIDQMLLCGKPKEALWGAGVVLVNRDTNCVLLGIRSDTKEWCTPGGHIENGETPSLGIIRECKEESGVSINAPYCYGITYNTTHEGIFTCFQFVASVSGDVDVTPQVGEIDELRWVPIRDVFEYTLYPVTKQCFHYLLDKRPELIIPEVGIQKLTALEQKVNIKNPGSNGGNVSLDGNYQKGDPGKKSEPSTKENPIITVDEIKSSFIEHFTANKVEKEYEVVNGQFVYPSFEDLVKKQKATSYTEYYKKFKEQYMIYALCERHVDTGNKKVLN